MNILIVDDEEEILEEIRSLTAQCTTFTNNVLSTASSPEAFDIISNQKIDILITDVRMPVYDGLHLASLLKERSPSAHLIFISAYDDKSYLKAAISLNADNYFEKPLCQNEFLKQLTATIQMVAVETSIHSISALAEMKLLFKHLLSDKEKAKKSEHQFSKYSLDGCCFLPVSLKAYTTNELLEMNKYILQSLSQYPSDNHTMHFCLYESFPSCFSIIFYGKKIDRLRISEILEDICNSNSTNTKFLIAIGNVVKNRYSIKKEHQSTLATLEYGFYCDYGIIVSEPIITDQKEHTIEPVKEIATFGQLLQKGNKQEVLSFVNQLYEKIKKSRMPATSAQYLIQQLLSKLCYFSEDHRILITLSYEEISGLHFHLFSEMQEYFDEQLECFFREYSRNDYVINRIKSYIASNYSNHELSVISITQELNLNTSYACSHFKKYTKMTINEYISRMRLNEAKRLIISGDLTINEVALSVGYKDPNYFYRFFKKSVGMTALEYKNSFLRQNQKDAEFRLEHSESET